MNYLACVLYAIGPISIGVMLLLFMSLGKRLGEALESPPYYKLYYVAIFFFLIPLPATCILLLLKAWGLPDPEPATGLIIRIFSTSVPMVVGITFAVWATARYWGWVWEELRSRKREGEKDGL